MEILVKGTPGQERRFVVKCQNCGTIFICSENEKQGDDIQCPECKFHCYYFREIFAPVCQREYQIWAEDRKLGAVVAQTFVEACILLLHDAPEFNLDGLRYGNVQLTER